TPLDLSIMGVACSVLEQLIEGWRRGLMGLGKLFCQAILPLLASTARSTSSMPMVKTRSLTPSDVETSPTTTGAVRVDSTTAGVLLSSGIFHSGLRRLTVLGESWVSPLFQPV